MKQKNLAVLIILIGFLFLIYPFLSNYIFEKSASSTIRSYQNTINNIKKDNRKDLLNDARKYNQNLLESKVELTDPFRQKQEKKQKVSYQKILNIDDSGIIGYIRIPCIFIELPIYHGTTEEVLRQGVGHLAASSFPIGGKDTHSVLTSHTGLSSARLFTDLIQMKKGDKFFIQVLNQNLAYKVEQIKVVKPENTKDLQIVYGKDYVTLVTCTPYGVNDHRLLVRGSRMMMEKKQEKQVTQRRGSKWLLVYKRAVLAGILIVIMITFIKKMIRKIIRGERI